MTKTGNKDTEEPAEKAAQPKKGLGLSLIQLIAGGGAAAVASVIGGHLGLAGTVVGAFILSVVSAIAVPLFHASLEKSHEQLKRVVPRRVTDPAQTPRPQMAADTANIVRATSGKVSTAPLSLEQPWEGLAVAQHAPHKSPRGGKVRMAIGGTATIFVVGVGSVLGIQSATGVALSNGTSTLQSGISQVVSTARNSTGTPATDPKPSAPAVEPSTVATDQATDPATDPTEQPAVTPTLTSEPAPSAEPTAPADADNPVPSSTPDPATGTSDGSSGADRADSQAQPGAGTSAGGAPTK
ncbi:hypothetical protein G9E11_15495 [Arthrobacter sp. IA7]|uniref:hypothetical protein n=1 Tax=Arthrobacter ipis TaxID=2716202 RepID=UPI001683AE99|nr:hypothetical protein [Arthrobacter ipis]MBD1543609.1 hypothetical protein [Arthrobacter ipis]